MNVVEVIGHASRLSGWSDPERMFCSSLRLLLISEVFFGRTNRFAISGDQFVYARLFCFA